MHNHWHVDFNDDGIDATITASQEGVFVIRRGDDGEPTGVLEESAA